MSSKLKQIDRELLLTNENFDYNNPENILWWIFW